MKLKKTSVECVAGPPNPKVEKDIIRLWPELNANPLVSIICHTYQHKNYIRDAINGFLMQETTFPFEIIIRDDASSDGTREIVEEYASKYPKIIKAILENTNQYSKGIKPSSITFSIAKGKYIAMCEGDDYWTDKKKLSVQAAFLEENDAYVIAYHDAVIVNSDGSVESESLLGVNKVDYSKNELVISATVPTLTRFFRNVVNEFPHEMGNVVSGDTFLISLLSNYGGAKYLDGIEPAVYRRHAGGIWSGVDHVKRNHIAATTFFWLSIYYRRIGNNVVSEKFKLAALMHFSKPLELTKITTLKFFIHNVSEKLYTFLRSLVRKLN